MESEQRKEHLLMIQGVIARMGQNSFALKGWSVTLVAAIFVLSSSGAKEQHACIATLPAIAFWMLDAYYVRQERLFRALFDAARTCEQDLAYTMDTKLHQSSVQSWARSLFTRTVILLHGPVVLIALGVSAWSIYC